MPPIKINTYDFNLTATENLKANFLADRLAKNRWGKKFARLYTPHMSDTIDDTIGTYDFTVGMRATLGDATTYSTDLSDTIAFKNTLIDNVKVLTDGVWSIEGALKHSYMAVLLESIEGLTFSGIEKAEVKGMHFSLSIEGDVGRKTSWFHSGGVNDGTVCSMEPLEYPDTDDFGLYLESDDSLLYGHYDGGLRTGTAHHTVLGLYGVEDRNEPCFAANQEARFTAIWDDLLKYAKLMVEDEVSQTVGERISVVVGLHQMLEYLDERIAILTESIDMMENSDDRVSDDLSLIDHLDISDTLREEITDPSKIRSLWFKMEKAISFEAVTDNGDGTSILNEEYAWWEEEQFDEIRLHLKDFQDHCIVVAPRGLYIPPIVRLKEEILSLAGHKIYWYVNAFLDVGARAKKPSFLQRVFNFLLLIVSIALVVATQNPIWIKLLLITTQVLGYFGVLTPKVQLIVGVVLFSYGVLNVNGVSNVNFSAMNGMQMFQWAFKNIDQIFKMVQMYDAIGIEEELKAQAKEDAKDKSVAQLQEETMDFIYTQGYSQYDDLYSIPYDYEPKYLR